MGTERVLEMMLTLVGLSSNGFPSQLELAAVADHDGSPRSVFFVCRNIHDPRDDVVVTTDHPAEHHVFAWLAEGHISELGEAARASTKANAQNERKRGWQTFELHHVGKGETKGYHSPFRWGHGLRVMKN